MKEDKLIAVNLGGKMEELIMIKNGERAKIIFLTHSVLWLLLT